MFMLSFRRPLPARRRTVGHSSHPLLEDYDSEYTDTLSLFDPASDWKTPPDAVSRHRDCRLFPEAVRFADGLGGCAGRFQYMGKRDGPRKFLVHQSRPQTMALVGGSPDAGLRIGKGIGPIVVSA